MTLASPPRRSCRQPAPASPGRVSLARQCRAHLPHRRRRLPVHAVGVALALLPLVARRHDGVCRLRRLGGPSRVPPWPGNASGGDCPLPAVADPHHRAARSHPDATGLPPAPASPGPDDDGRADARAYRRHDGASTAAASAPAPRQRARPRRSLAWSAATRRPTPFEHPPWRADSVVGGEQLGASGVIADVGAGGPLPPEVYDVSYVVADLDSGEILAAKSPHAWLRPASTLKALTALTLMPRLDPRTVVDRERGRPGGGRLARGHPRRQPLHRRQPRRRDDDVLGQRRRLRARRRRGRLRQDRRADERDRSRDRCPRHASSSTRAASTRATSAPAPTTSPSSPATPCGCPPSGPPSSSAMPSSPAARTSRARCGSRSTSTTSTSCCGTTPAPSASSRVAPTVPSTPSSARPRAAAAPSSSTQMGSITGSWKPTAALLDWGFANADRVTPVGTLVEPGEAGPPTPQPSLTSLPSRCRDDTAAGPRPPLPPSGRPAPRRRPPLAASPHDGVRSGDPTSLIVVRLAGALVTAAAAGLAIHRRRRRARAHRPGTTLIAGTSAAAGAALRRHPHRPHATTAPAAMLTRSTARAGVAARTSAPATCVARLAPGGRPGSERGRADGGAAAYGSVDRSAVAGSGARKAGRRSCQRGAARSSSERVARSTSSAAHALASSTTRDMRLSQKSRPTGIATALRIGLRRGVADQEAAEELEDA